MTNDLPYFPFYPSDWLSSTRPLSQRAKAALIDILATLWSNTTNRGILAMHTHAWARLLNMPEPEANATLTELERCKACTKKALPDDTTEISSPRLMRLAAELKTSRQSNSERAAKAANARWNGKKPNRPGNAQAMLADAKIDSDSESDNLSVQAKSFKNGVSSEGGAAGAPTGSIPTLADALQYAEVQGLNREVTKTWWHDREGDGWVKLTGKWTSNLTSYIRKWESRTEENKKRPQPPAQKHSAKMTDEEMLKAAL